jgi:hypothetical protein
MVKNKKVGFCFSGSQSLKQYFDPEWQDLLKISRTSGEFQANTDIPTYSAL